MSWGWGLAVEQVPERAWARTPGVPADYLAGLALVLGRGLGQSCESGWVSQRLGSGCQHPAWGRLRLA